MSGRSSYRPLLPAAASASARARTDRDKSASDPSSASQPPDTNGTAAPAKRRAIGASTACSECRVRKKKCDGARPVCSNCAARRIDACYYNDPVEDSASEILKLLRSLSLSRARAALAVLRSHQDSGAALSIIRQNKSPSTSPSRSPNASPIEAGPSGSRGIHSGRPGSGHPSLATELSEVYPSAYLKLKPVSSNDIRQSHLIGSGRTAPVSHPPPQNGTKPRGRNQVQDHNHEQGEKQDQEQLELGDKHALDDDSVVQRYRQQSSTSGRSDDAFDLCDYRLQRLDISFWTTVKVSNEFAARAISLYLETDHPLLGLFDPHLFVADLVEHRTRYCSSFLVNALMYLSCQMYTALDKRASEHVTPFWDEANRLQIQDADCESTCTMSALVLMSLSLTGHGKDRDVIRFSKHANIIGHNLGFFDPDSALARKNESDMGEEDRACCHAAWSSFNWSMIIAMFYRQPEIVVVDRPPALPILNCWTSAAVQQQQQQTVATISAGMHSHGTASQTILSGAVFTALCQFWRILHGALWVYYPGEMTAPPENLKWKLAEHKFCEILAWTKQLPDVLTRVGPHSSQVDVLHMWLHAALMDLLRPFIGQQQSTDMRLTTFAADDSSALSAYKASTDQLKRLILDYRTNYEASAYSILWHTGLLYLVNAMLEKPRDPDWHIYFLLCIHGYENLRRPYVISEAIGRSLLALTLRRTDMSADEARRIMAEIEKGGLGRVEAKIRAPFMGDLQMALNDPENASVETTARLFEEMALFNEVLEQSVMDIS